MQLKGDISATSPFVSVLLTDGTIFLLCFWVIPIKLYFSCSTLYQKCIFFLSWVQIKMIPNINSIFSFLLFDQCDFLIWPMVTFVKINHKINSINDIFASFWNFVLATVTSLIFFINLKTYVLLSLNCMYSLLSG